MAPACKPATGRAIRQAQSSENRAGHGAVKLDKAGQDHALIGLKLGDTLLWDLTRILGGNLLAGPAQLLNPRFHLQTRRGPTGRRAVRRVGGCRPLPKRLASKQASKQEREIPMPVWLKP